jgi:hypothetical protein
MTGAYVRIQRDGNWRSIEFDQLTYQEMDAFAEDNPNDGWKWAIFLAQWIRDNISNHECEFSDNDLGIINNNKQEGGTK